MRQHPGRAAAAVGALLVVVVAAVAASGDPTAVTDVAALTAPVEATTPAAPAADEPAPAPAPAQPSAEKVATVAADPCRTDASDDWPIERLSGADRYATAACVARVGYPDGADTVVLARGDEAGGFADALAGTVLARHADGPVLLTHPTTLPEATSAALRELAPSTVLVLGGEAAVSTPVAAEVDRLVETVTRVRGSDRAGTAAAIAEIVGGDTAFLVNGTRPADALTAGAAAARAGAVLLLTGNDHLPDATITALAGRTAATIVGGPGVVSELAARDIRARVENVARLGGIDRYETAATVARTHPGDGTHYVVGGADRNLVDAIAAGWLAAAPGGGPVLYSTTDAPGRGTDRYLRLGALASAPTLRLVGGAASLTPALVATLEARYAEATDGGPAPQLRGMWVHLFDSSLKTRAGIERVLDAATAGNLNTVIVQVARRHDAFYRSDVIPATTDPDLEAGLDLLAELVPAAHARGLQVHAWYSVMPSMHPSMADENLGPTHVNSLHGMGSTDPWMQAGNAAGYQYLDPAIPGVQDHVAAMLREVAERYDVDGVHLDYLRYECLQANDNGTCAAIPPDTTPPATLNQHPITMQRWQAVGAGRSLDQFMRDQTQDLMRRVYLEVADADPTTLVTGALIAQGAGPTGSDLRASFEGTKAYWNKGQDWRTWIDEGIVDHAYPMVYFNEANGVYASWYDQWVAFTAAMNGPDVVAAAGVGAWPEINTEPNALGQLRQSAGATDGTVVYSYQGVRAYRGDLGLLTTLAATDFATPAPVPTVPRKASPTQGHVQVMSVDGASVTITPVGGDPRTRRADATGHAGFAWVDPGVVQVSVNGGPPRPVTVEPGRVATVDMR
jgi:uncharacterized lipoprotein YddW (UPF0748 family)/putative cell wall-binding protein